MAVDPEYCIYCMRKPCLLPELKTKTHLRPLLVHSEFHLLVTALQDAMQVCFNEKECGGEDYQDAYAALSQRRKELYEWVAQQTEPPSLLYAIRIKF